MTTTPKVGVDLAIELRDLTEDYLYGTVSGVLRDFLADVKRAALSAVRTGTLTAASAVPDAPEPDPFAPSEIPSLGAQAGRWAAGVDAYILATIEDAYRVIYSAYAPGLAVTSDAEAAMLTYISHVRDRLVQGTYFGVTVYGESFDAVRVALAQSSVEGWTRQDLARRIAAELAWDGDSAYWEAAKANAGSKIDAILDPLGPPGAAAREYARLNDPKVAALRAEMNRATRHLDDAQSVWQQRAMLIARTEATGVANYGALSALAAEGFTEKIWIASRDSRTRESHRRADGQRVALAGEFRVGGYALAHPGDPAAPASETANCRCTIIGGTNTLERLPAQSLPYVPRNPNSMGEIPLDTATLNALRKSPITSKYLTADGRFTEERERLHAQIIEDTLAGVKPTGKSPVLYFSGGGPGSGKSSMVKGPNAAKTRYPLTREVDDLTGYQDKAVRHPGAVLIDPDAVKMQLPDVREMRDEQRALPRPNPFDSWAGDAHEESSYLAKRITQASYDRGLDVVADGTGDGKPAKVIAKTAAAREAGYRVEANYLFLEPTEGISRAAVRAERVGRVVPATSVTNIYGNIPTTFTVAKDSGAFDTVKLFDNNVAFGQPANLIYEIGDDGVEHIYDQAAYDRFLSSNERVPGFSN